MNKILRHRGPDDEGFVLCNTINSITRSFSGDDSIDFIKNNYENLENADFNQFNVILGHRRLSIIDLTEKGHEPMCDIEKKIWITYNGEIYNYIELRDELKKYGYQFYSSCDTEVIINSYLHWGVECLNHFNGMWGFAIYDTRDRTLFLARDRFGIKPLYYTLTADYFSFSSEIKPLIFLSPELYQINEKKIPFFILFGNRLNTEETYIQNIFSLKPSHYLIFKNGQILLKRYYDIPCKKFDNEKYLGDELLNLLTDSIKLRFRSDVPVGTCLSGGFDSSSIVSISSSFNPNSINTFSAVWSDKESDESKYIDIVNKNFNCLENKVEPKTEEFWNIFKRLSYYQEIPTEGPGLYPQWFVMGKASDKVKVLLDGQGGDEVFGGYYELKLFLFSLIKDLDLKQIFNNFFKYKLFLNYNEFHSFIQWIFPGIYNKVYRGNFTRRNNILHKDLITGKTKEEIYFDAKPPKVFKNFLNNMSYHFIYNMTIPTLLHYEDRASMAHSIESRVPFLDFRLVEFGLNLEPKNLLDRNVSRPLFRKALSKTIPDEIVNRKDKLGYPTPFKKWSRTILKPLINDILLNSNSLFRNYLDQSYIKERLTKHYNEKIDFSWDIWRILSFEEFLKLFNNKDFINVFR